MIFTPDSLCKPRCEGIQGTRDHASAVIFSLSSETPDESLAIVYISVGISSFSFEIPGRAPMLCKVVGHMLCIVLMRLLDLYHLFNFFEE